MNKTLEFNQLYEKADDLFERKAYQIALDLINTALSIDTFIPPKSLFEAYLLRADIQIHMKKYAYGISDCREAIKIYPSSSRGFSLKGFAFLKIVEILVLYFFLTVYFLSSDGEIFFAIWFPVT